MPLLTHWEEPAFETVGEVLEFFRQILEVCSAQHPFNIYFSHLLLQGVQFMHSVDMAHK
jgi:hypothetical protein